MKDDISRLAMRDYCSSDRQHCGRSRVQVNALDLFLYLRFSHYPVGCILHGVYWQPINAEKTTSMSAWCASFLCLSPFPCLCWSVTSRGDPGLEQHNSKDRRAPLPRLASLVTCWL